MELPSALKTKNPWKILLAAVSLIVLTILSFQMLMITLEYIPISSKVGFLRIKQWMFRKYPGFISKFWLSAFYIHVFTSMIVLLAGYTQFSRFFYKRKMHRNFGKIYVFVVLFLSGPTGLIMGIYANGGIYSQIAFITLSILWMTSTLFAFKYAFEKKFEKHKNLMIISYALTLSALTLRAWKFGITNFTDLNLRPMQLYRIVAWLGWVPNLLVALMIIVISKKNINA